MSRPSMGESNVQSPKGSQRHPLSRPQQPGQIWTQVSETIHTILWNRVPEPLTPPRRIIRRPSYLANARAEDAQFKAAMTSLLDACERERGLLQNKAIMHSCNRWGLPPAGLEGRLLPSALPLWGEATAEVGLIHERKTKQRALDSLAQVRALDSLAQMREADGQERERRCPVLYPLWEADNEITTHDDMGVFGRVIVLGGI